ncbi:MAG: CDP-alcohol phosphatidyltransferase family protein [Candidatus Saccharimonadales bacterium]
MSFSSKELPLLASLENTIESWPEMRPSEKTAAILANMTSAARPAARLIHELHRKGKPSSADIIASLAIMLSDKADGVIAKTFDGQTEFGKEFDPLMDKFDFFIWEFAQYQRGNLTIHHLITRLGRDIAVTLVRSHVKGATDGAVDISAGWQGKTTTAIRGASLVSTDTTLERFAPRTLHQHLATAAIVTSGAINIKNLLNEKTNYLNSLPVEQRED